MLRGNIISLNQYSLIDWHTKKILYACYISAATKCCQGAPALIRIFTIRHFGNMLPWPAALPQWEQQHTHNGSVWHKGAPTIVWIVQRLYDLAIVLIVLYCALPQWIESAFSVKAWLACRLVLHSGSRCTFYSEHKQVRLWWTTGKYLRI